MVLVVTGRDKCESIFTWKVRRIEPRTSDSES